METMMTFSVENYPDFSKSYFKVGDTCHIWLSYHQGRISEGKVVAVLNLPGWNMENYVIAVETAMDLYWRCVQPV
jgi:hypothetical protein